MQSPEIFTDDSGSGFSSGEIDIPSPTPGSDSKYLNPNRASRSQTFGFFSRNDRLRVKSCSYYNTGLALIRTETECPRLEAGVK